MPGQSGTPAIYTALFAFISWGLLPAYWKTMQAIPAISILCHRMLWSCLFIALILSAQKRWKEIQDAFCSGQKLLVLLTSGLVVGSNWFLYIWAVNSGYVLEAALGYYINPLCNIFLGCLFFRDRLRTAQTISICCAVLGVGYMLVEYGRLPWIALFLAFSFSIYGLIRKIVNVMPLPGLFIETLFLSFPALIYLIFFAPAREAWPAATPLCLLLISSGVATSLPLWAFTFSAKNLSLVTVGLLQFIAPSLTFLLGVFAYKEPFTPAHLVTFSCIWAGLFIYSLETWVRYRQPQHLRKKVR